MVTVLVTGGAGFIGSHLVERLLEDGHFVRVFDDLSSGNLDNLSAVRNRIQIINASLLDKGAVRGAVAGCDAVFHLAARTSVPESIADPGGYMDVNVTGTANLLGASLEAGVRRVVMASSAAVYGTEIEPPHTESTVSSFRSSPYAVSKFAMEDLGKEFSKRGLPCISLRLFNVFGPRQRADSGYAAAIPAFMQAIADGKDPVIFGDGSQTRDFTYVTNVAEAFARAGFLPGIGGVYNIGSGKPSSVHQLVSVLLSITGSKSTATHAPERAGDIKHSTADISRATKHLGAREMVTFTEGLKKTWEWKTGQ